MAHTGACIRVFGGALGSCNIFCQTCCARGGGVLGGARVDEVLGLLQRLLDDLLRALLPGLASALLATIALRMLQNRSFLLNMTKGS